MSTMSQREPAKQFLAPFITEYLAPDLAQEVFRVPDAALKQGIHIMGGPGSGKSRLMGRFMAWEALIRGLPAFVCDPTGQITANLFDKLSRLLIFNNEDLAQYKNMVQRIVYVDVG